MKYKTTMIEAQMQVVRKRLRDFLFALDEYCDNNNLPEVVVTSLLRPDDPKSQHFRGEAADIRAHHLSAPQLASMYRFASEHFFRKELSSTGYQLRCFYPHGEGDNFHVHLSIDHNG
jgi:hypothetical protein